MKITGIICEYNPLHLGHYKQLKHIKKEDPDGAIVCLMSGDYVQRGEPAIFHKTHRAKSAILCGADLVLEMPVTASLCSAEGFASKSVSILTPFCHQLSFGAETGEPSLLLSVAKALLHEEFPAALHMQLDKGLSFPAARQAALNAMGVSADILKQPNNILAVEYCKAILSQGSGMIPQPIVRNGNYHATHADSQDPSATAVRELICSNQPWNSFIPPDALCCLKSASVHTLQAGEQAILYRLRTMQDHEFQALPYGSEGLWRKLMKACRTEVDLEHILLNVKSKRYTRTRLDRMVMCAFLGLTDKDLTAPIPYVRVLALNTKGRQILKSARQTGLFPNIGEKMDHPYQETETRCGDLYGLFAVEGPEPPGQNHTARVFVQER